MGIRPGDEPDTPNEPESVCGDRVLRPPSPEVRGDIRRLHKEGLSVSRIARMLLLTKPVVRAVLEYRL